MSTVTLEGAQSALSDARDMLAADGYDLALQLAGDELHVEVVAGPDACADCLVPRTVMEPMLVDMLRAQGLEAPVRVTYPEGSAAD